jgi:hypothetical protein
MGRVREQQVAYKVKPKRKTGGSRKRERREFVLDAEGNRVGIILDIPTYERFLEAQEELEDIQAYDEAKAKADAEFRAGKFVTLAEYSKKRRLQKR